MARTQVCVSVYINVCVCVCVCVCVQLHPFRLSRNRGKTLVMMRILIEQDVEEQQQVVVVDTAAVDDETNADFWANWDPRLALNNVLRGRMSKGVFLFSCTIMDASC